MSELGVRRAKAALSSGCKPHPATAPAGSNRSSYGGDEIAEAFGMRATNWWQRECAGRDASKRRASLEKDDAQADPTTLSGKADTAGGMSEAVRQPLRRGSSIYASRIVYASFNLAASLANRSALSRSRFLRSAFCSSS